MPRYKIDRTRLNILGHIPVYDEDGNETISFPPKWTDGDIMHVMNLLDSWFSKGFIMGQKKKERDIRKALGI